MFSELLPTILYMKMQEEIFGLSLHFHSCIISCSDLLLMLYACLFWGYMHKFGEMSASWSVRVCIVLVLNPGVLNRVKIEFADI